jgi:hypothetical protein
MIKKISTAKLVIKYIIIINLFKEELLAPGRLCWALAIEHYFGGKSHRNITLMLHATSN